MTEESDEIIIELENVDDSHVVIEGFDIVNLNTTSIVTNDLFDEFTYEIELRTVRTADGTDVTNSRRQPRASRSCSKHRNRRSQLMGSST
ncbi:hypothetical protein D8S78_19365 [Natrialba swarupiae]|nr:hypothetical protein [Natrialba swarupiae]